MKFFLLKIIQVGIILGGNCPGANCPGANCPGWKLSGGNCPGANCPGANCPVTLYRSPATEKTFLAEICWWRRLWYPLTLRVSSVIRSEGPFAYVTEHTFGFGLKIIHMSPVTQKKVSGRNLLVETPVVPISTKGLFTL